MDSLSAPQRQEALSKIALLCAKRREDLPEEAIADKLGFGSVEAMHIYFDNLELPAWLSGATSRDESEKEKQAEYEPQRHARTASEKPAELPPAYDALFLFHRALMKLDCAIGDLENRKEYLQDGRFIAHEDTGPVDLPERGIEGGTMSVPLGGRQMPLEPLPALVGAYFLAGEPLEPLLEKLNRRPEAVDKGQIQRLIEGEKTPKGHKRGLRSVAELIARGMRGGKIRGGQTTGEFSTRIQNGVWYSRQLADRGLATETISERLSEAGFTRDEISRIQSLNKIPKPQ